MLVRRLKPGNEKTDYSCINKKEAGRTVRIHQVEKKKVKKFEYLNSAVKNNGEYGEEVRKKNIIDHREVQVGWSGWRRLSGAIYDRRVEVRVKGKVYKAGLSIVFGRA